MTNTLQEALRLSQTFGWSVVPLRPKEKVAYIQWKELQERKLSSAEIFNCWAQFPDANLGVILGEISGLAQIDCDDSTAVDFMAPYIQGVMVPTVKTRRGMHYYFKCDPDLQTASGHLHPKLEYRTRGHLAVVPPSIRSDGEAYQWVVTVEECGGIPALPPKLKDELRLAQEKAGGAPYTPPDNVAPYTFGRRDDDLFHTAYTLLRGGMDPSMVNDALRRIASTMDQKDMPNIDIKVASAMRRAAGRGERNVSLDIRTWLNDEARGSFNLQEMFSALSLHSKEEQNAARMALLRLSEEGTLVRRNPERWGWYRATKEEAPKTMEWENANALPLDLALPLLLNTVFETYPKNILIVASPPDMGKTVFLQHCIKLNMDRWDVIYQNCEMSPEELHRRLKAHTDVEKWKMRVYERNADFYKLVEPNALNIIDYMEVSGDFWKVNSMLTAIHEKLDKGVAIVGLQKSFFADIGRGAEFGLEKPRLYVTLDRGVARLIKCKNRPAGQIDSAFGKQLEYEIRGGWQLIPTVTEWHHPIADETKKRSSGPPVRRLFP